MGGRKKAAGTTTTTAATAAVETDAPVECAWVGDPVRRTEGLVFYEEAVVNGEHVRAGDCVHLRARGESKPVAGQSYVGRVTRMWEDEHVDERYVDVMWYYYPQDTQQGRRAHHHDREVFESTHSDCNLLDTVLGVVRVLEEETFAALSAAEQARAYVCRLHYNVASGQFRPRMSLPLLRQDLRSAAIMSPKKKKKKAKAKAKTKEKGKRSVRELAEAARAKRRRMAAPPAPATATDAYREARARLGLSSVPDVLPCRDSERGEIMTFLHDAVVNEGCGDCLYIHGVPGTGKTATVHEVVRTLRRDVSVPFQFVEINAMKLPDPHAAYSFLWRSLTGKHVSAARAAGLLEKRFCDARSTHPCCVLLLDELDYLVTRKHTVLYNLFDWPRRPHSRLVVVGIANTMDLPERLAPRVYSRIGLRRVAFKSYSNDQLQRIIVARLAGLDAFEESTIKYCALKIASVSGDVRRALEIARRASEFAQREHAALGDANAALVRVGMGHVQAALEDVASEVHMDYIARASTHEKLLLVALVLESRTTGLMEVPFEQLSDRHRVLCRANHIAPIPPVAALLDVCHALSAVKVIDMDVKRCERARRVRLVCVVDDVIFALRDDVLAKTHFAHIAEEL